MINGYLHVWFKYYLNFVSACRRKIVLLSHTYVDNVIYVIYYGGKIHNI